MTASIYEREVEEILVGKSFAQVYPIAKYAGDPLTASGSFAHKGPAEAVVVSWWITGGHSLPGVHQEDRTKWVLVGQSQIAVPNDPVLVTYSFNVSGHFPSSLPALPASYSWNNIDCRVAVMVGGVWKVDKWWDDVYTIAQAEYRDLTATFT